ncbi:MAG: FG-GAP repeat domain-containing protein [Nitrospinaceae bacterium]
MTFKPALTLRIALFLVLPLWVAAPAGAADSNVGLERLVSQIETMFPPMEGYVISVDQDILTLDLKQGEPVQKGDTLKLIRYGKEIIHPVTKKKVGRRETDLGTAEVLEVRKDFSLARVTDPTIEVRPGDGVRSPFQKIRFILAPPQVETQKKIDAGRLRLNLETQLNQHPRFEVPAFELGLWLIENDLTPRTLRQPDNLARLREEVQADFIMVLRVRSVKKKMVLSYKLFSTTDGALKKQAKILSGPLPLAPRVSKSRPREQGVQSSFAPRKGLLAFEGRHEFPFELVDFDVGDVNGDGEKDFVIIDRYRVMIYEFRKGKFKRVGQIKTRQGANWFLTVDVGDINQNGRDEIFVTNQVDKKLQSFVLEFVPGSKRPKKIWKDVNLYFRIIHPFGAKPVLMAQSPGFQEPFKGPVKTIHYKNHRYMEGAKLRLPSLYGTEFILYGLTQAKLTSKGEKDTILLDTDYHLRVYSPSGRLLVKSNDYYGHDPRIIDVGVQEDIEGIVQQGEPVHFKGRLEFVETGGSRFLLLPKNHRLGGELLARAVVVSNSSLVILSVTREGFEKIFETKKQRGYLAAYQVTASPESNGTKVHVATVQKSGLFGKTISTIFTYDWRG